MALSWERTSESNLWAGSRPSSKVESGESGGITMEEVSRRRMQEVRFATKGALVPKLHTRCPFNTSRDIHSNQ